MSEKPAKTPPLIAAAVATPVPSRVNPAAKPAAAASAKMGPVKMLPQDQQNNLPPHMRGKVAGMPPLATPSVLVGRAASPLVDGPGEDVVSARMLAGQLRNLLGALLQGAATTIEQVDIILAKARDNDLFIKALELEGMPPDVLTKLRKECVDLIDAQKPPVAAS